jgi:hypothetical protein
MEKNTLERMEIAFEVEANLSGFTVMLVEVGGGGDEEEKEGVKVEEL